MKDTKRRHTPYTKFKAYLDENHVSQKEVAGLIGKSPSAINQNLNGGKVCPNKVRNKM